MPLPIPSIRSRIPSPARLDVLVSVPVALGLIVALGFLLATTVFRNLAVSPEDMEELRRSVIPEVFKGLAPEPLERWLFISLTLLLPLCISVALAAVRTIRLRFLARIAEHCHPIGMTKSRLELAIGAASLAAAWGALTLLHGKSMLQFYFFPGPLLDFLSLGSSAGLLFWAMRGTAARWKRPLFWALLVTSALIVLLPRGLSVHTALGEDPKILARSCWGIHFQASMYALTQVVAGKPLLTAAPPLYGCYAVFLAPLFRVIGLSLFKITLVMSALIIVAHGCLLFIASRHIRDWRLLVLFASSLFYTAGIWVTGNQPFDVFFQYWPLRYLFPALSVPLFASVARRPTLASLAGLGIVCGVALIWNLESGIAVTGAVLCTLGLQTAGRLLRREPARWCHLATVAALTAMTVGICRGALLVQSAGVQPFRTTADYQRLFYIGGATMIPLPLNPHPWFLVQIVYATALTLGIRGLLFTRSEQSFSRLLAYLAILGEGTFIYYQGRSHDFNLLGVAWPALLLGFLMTDRLLREIRAGLLPASLRWMALPATYYGAMAALMTVALFPTFVKQGSERWWKTLTAAPDPMVEHTAFIRRHTAGHRDCVILASLQAAYFAETGLRSQYDCPGYSELCFKADLDALKLALMIRPARHLFTDAKLLELFHLTETVAAHYQAVDVTSDRKLSYWEPK